MVFVATIDALKPRRMMTSHDMLTHIAVTLESFGASRAQKEDVGMSLLRVIVQLMDGSEFLATFAANVLSLFRKVFLSQMFFQKMDKLESFRAILARISVNFVVVDAVIFGHVFGQIQFAKRQPAVTAKDFLHSRFDEFTQFRFSPFHRQVLIIVFA